METETATPEVAPVEAPAAENDALADFLAEDDTPKAQPDEDGQSAEAEPAPEGEAQEAEGEDEETPPVEDPKYKVKVRGEELEVPLSELLNGYSRTEDYKAKTAEVAEQRRTLESQYADKLEQQVQLFTALDPVLAQAQNIDWVAYSQQDPAGCLQLQTQVNARIATIQAAEREIGAIRQQEQQQQAQALQEYHKAEREALVKALPELADPVKAESFAKNAADYLRSIGASNDDISALDDHRSFVIIDKAMKWDALQRAKATAETKKAPPGKQTTLSPRAAESPRAPKKPGPNASDSERQAWVLAQLDAE